MPPIHPSLVVHAPLPAIRRYARKIAERFGPEKIVLFGSRAWGEPHAESDVDLFVVTQNHGPKATAFRIRTAFPAPFPMDLIVRTQANVARRLADGESFITQVMTQGKVLYEKTDAGVGAEGRSRPLGRDHPRGRRRAAP